MFLGALPQRHPQCLLKGRSGPRMGLSPRPWPILQGAPELGELSGLCAIEARGPGLCITAFASHWLGATQGGALFLGQPGLCQGHCLVKDTAVSHWELGASALEMGFGENINVFSREGVSDLGVGGSIRKIHLLKIKTKDPMTQHYKNQIPKGVLTMRLEHVPFLLSAPGSSEGDAGGCLRPPTGVLSTAPRWATTSHRRGAGFTSLGTEGRTAGLGLTGVPGAGRPVGPQTLLFCSKGREALGCKESCCLLSCTLLCPRQCCLTDRGPFVNLHKTAVPPGAVSEREPSNPEDQHCLSRNASQAQKGSSPWRSRTMR